MYLASPNHALKLVGIFALSGVQSSIVLCVASIAGSFIPFSGVEYCFAKGGDLEPGEQLVADRACFSATRLGEGNTHDC